MHLQLRKANLSGFFCIWNVVHDDLYFTDTLLKPEPNYKLGKIFSSFKEKLTV